MNVHVGGNHEISFLLKSYSAEQLGHVSHISLGVKSQPHGTKLEF